MHIYIYRIAVHLYLKHNIHSYCQQQEADAILPELTAIKLCEYAHLYLSNICLLIP